MVQYTGLGLDQDCTRSPDFTFWNRMSIQVNGQYIKKSPTFYDAKGWPKTRIVPDDQTQNFGQKCLFNLGG